MKNYGIFGIEGTQAKAQGLDDAINRLKNTFDDNKLRGSEALGTASLSVEGLDSSSLRSEATDIYEATKSSLEAIYHSSFSGVDELSEAGAQAAGAAAILASNVGAYLKSSPNGVRGSMEGVPVLTGNGLTNTVEARSLSTESYDQRELRDTTVYSIAYNAKHGNQDEFAESFFPTVTVSPDQVGYTVTMNIMSVMNEVRRDLSGDETDFGRKNLIHAIIDPTILDNDQTRLIPVYRDGSTGADSSENFVDVADVPTSVVKMQGIEEEVTTGALKFGRRIDLIGISQTESLLETGILDSTDAIDTSLFLDTVYMKASDEVIPLRVRHLPETNFTSAPQGNWRELRLMFDTKSVLLGGTAGKILLADQTESVAFAPVVDNELALRLSFVISGKVNVETGALTLNANNIEIGSLRNAQGELVAESDALYQTIAGLLADAEMLGFKLDGYRTNSNRRQRGQLINTTYQSQMYAPQLRSPITVPRPETNVDQTDSIDIAALMVATGIRTTNAAIDQLFITQQVLADHFNAADPVAATPTILGVALGPIRPFYETAVIDVEAELNALRSSEKTVDAQHVLLNRMRDVMFRAYRESGYKPVADALNGGTSPKPTVLVGTDPVIAQYLMVHGDLRTFGAEMDFSIVSTFNQRMKDQIFMTFVNPNSAKSGVPDPLTFGNMGWKPELVIALPTYFNGANSRQITVQPCFIHNVNCPILAHFEVLNLSKAMVSKTAIDNNDVTP